MVLDKALDRVGARGTLQRGLSYYSGRMGDLLRRRLGYPVLAEDGIPLWSETMSHRQCLDHLFRCNFQFLSCRRCADLLEKLFDRFPVGPVKVRAHDRPHTRSAPMQTR